MPIAALPPSTVSAIGSTQALTDSASLVKELIDNAIDARATVICIEISANTLDDIRVRDNGHGIAPEDRPLMCTRHCTSKIRDLEDLQNMGGRSLGFRGEALASAAEMSGCLTISTRIEGEPTAAEILFNRQGQISSEKRTSLPVGTTVRVEKFLETLPVRKQTALKTPVKVLTKTKRTLQADALARPHLRLSFKILKAKNDKDSWKYPKKGQTSDSRITASPITAATEMFGQKVIDHCQWASSSWSSAGEEIRGLSEGFEIGANQTEAYTFEAVLARQNGDASVISNMGQFISLDSRAVSLRGTFKQIISRYKSGLRSASANDEGSKFVDPFLCMNIICPEGSYDVNVEPAKDDVLFAHPDLVLRLVEKFFKSIYGEPHSDSPEARNPPTPKAHGIDLMLARKKAPVKEASPVPHLPARSISVQRSHDRPSRRPLNPQDSYNRHAGLCSQSGSHASGSTSPVATHLSTTMRDKDLFEKCTFANNLSSSILPELSGELNGEALLPSEPSKNYTWKSSMYAEDDNDMEMDNAIEDEATLQSVHVSNPWVMAKLNAPFRPPKSVHQEQGRIYQLPTPGRQKGDVDPQADVSSENFINDFTTMGPDLPILGQSGHQVRIDRDPVYTSPCPFPFPQKARGPRQFTKTPTRSNASNRERYGRGALDTWVQRSLNSSAEPFGQDSATEADIEPEGFQRRGEFVSARSLPQGTALGEIPDASQRPRRRPAPWTQQQGVVPKPFISPVNDPERVWFETGDKPKRKHPQHTRRREEPQIGTLMLRDDEIDDAPSQLSVSSRQTVHPDLALTLDYEARKRRAELQHRERLRQQAATESREAKTAAAVPNAKISPHKNRQNKAIAALHNDDHASEEIPLSGNTHIFEADDPRAYLLREQQREAVQLQAGPNGSRPKRRKTTLLPFESMREANHIRDLTLPMKFSSLHIEQMVEKSAQHDDYACDGQDAEAFASLSTQEVKSWEEKLKELVRASYRIEGMTPEEEMDGELDVDLVTILQEHAAETAQLEAEEQNSLEAQGSEAQAVVIDD